jgi:dinuclear metal center YbgI/SA1388 family protein
MNWTVTDIIKVAERIAPPVLAEAWDNVGLQVGHPEWPVKRVWVALDPLPQVVADACRAGVDLLITHHPLIFKPLKSVDCGSPIGSIIQEALLNRLTIFAAHTNLDSASDGVNDTLANRIGLQDLAPLRVDAPGDAGVDDSGAREEVQGLGRIGRLVEKMSLRDLAIQVKEKIGLEHVTIAGPPDLQVETIALCSGSGSSLMSAFLATGAQVYVSGDLRYHDARDAEIAGRGLIDIGHFDSEHLIVDVLAERLQAAMHQTENVVEIRPYRLEKNPFVVL